jgi:hypothetical protein
MPTAINLNTRPFSVYRIKMTAKKIIHNSRTVVDEKLISAPALQETIKDPPVVLRENLDYVVEDGSIAFVSGLFTATEPAPEVMWAECAVFDNREVIENNFGRLVNFRLEDLSSSQTSAPYLSAVRGLFFAYTNGPTVSNIRLGLQILLGLPFAEEKGVILEVNDEFSVDSSGNPLGRFLIEDLDDEDRPTGTRRVYFYSTLVGVEDNPTTNSPYVAGDKVSRFAPLSKGVSVSDYINDPSWWQRSLTGAEILKFFTFKIFVDSIIFNSDDLAFAISFIRAIKPSYTNIIATATQSFSDDIRTNEVLGGNAILKFYDNTWGLEATNRTNDRNQQGAYLWSASSPPYSTRSLSMLTDMVTSKSAEVSRIPSGVLGRAQYSSDPSRFYVGDYTNLHQPKVRVGDTLNITSGSYVGSYEIVEIISTTQFLVEGAPFTSYETGITYNIAGSHVQVSSATGWSNLVRAR